MTAEGYNNYNSKNILEGINCRLDDEEKHVSGALG